MISEIKAKTGTSGNCLGYDLGDMLNKDQNIRIIDYNGLFIMAPDILKLEAPMPTDAEERKAHKKFIHDLANDLSSQFDQLASLGDERMNVRFVEYILSFSPDERERLTPDFLRTVVLDYLERMGVHGSGRDSMFLATEHLGTNAPHVHVFTCRVDMQSLKASDINRDRIRNKKVCADLTKKYGLVRKTRNYQRDISKTNDGYKARLFIKEAIDEAFEKGKRSCDFFARFPALLAEKGVSVSLKLNADESRSVRGWTFTYDGHTYSGSQIGREYTLPKVRQEYELYKPFECSVGAYDVRKMCRERSDVLQVRNRHTDGSWQTKAQYRHIVPLAQDRDRALFLASDGKKMTLINHAGLEISRLSRADLSCILSSPTAAGTMRTVVGSPEACSPGLLKFAQSVVSMLPAEPSHGRGGGGNANDDNSRGRGFDNIQIFTEDFVRDGGPEL